MLGFMFLCMILSAAKVLGEDCANQDQGHCSATERQNFDQETDWQRATSIYDFHAKDIHGNNVSLEKYQGHVAIIVNVASDCGLTDRNYKQLVTLHQKYKDSHGLRILAFPCNQFGGQESGTAQQILDFVKRYNVEFDMFEKIDVNGDKAHPLWKWLKSQQGGFLTDDIKWNFTKFVIDKQGHVVSRFAPTTDPLEMESALKSIF
ncbi:probable phospholipid hydroperoxide glutathione peroxidase [Cephus cinctus]|uniref:Glutathione peroxidase n=1 Tax=Cephus cinctus TaxID=211228 RepID=A0AAJ7BZ78_CEPCN|nr:probable phospholipid hydroperoxide glutathione peroxidase [Cephus cinctus]